MGGRSITRHSAILQGCDIMVDTTLRDVLPDGIDCWPPTEDELPYEGEAVPESNIHRINPILLQIVLQFYLANRREAFIGTDMFVYYSPEQVTKKDFLSPDFFVVLDRPMEARKSWVIWYQDGRGPDVVIEMLSDSTRSVDLGKKRLAYQDQVRVAEYFWYDPWTAEVGGLRRVGSEFEPVAAEPDGSLICTTLELKLTIWEGTYAGLTNRWLRWATLDAVLLPTPDEAALQLAEQQRQFADEQRQAADEQRRVADEQRARAEAAEAENARLRQLLEERGR